MPGILGRPFRHSYSNGLVVSDVSRITPEKCDTELALANVATWLLVAR
ncbi:hypothetical protein [Arachidicoccus terrestris]|nr:hypothetical protein [Arachidicoccus terrestris]UAY55654.1 hypothetical protein K9M52_01075 [Arachidicoccus terrestris]